MWTSPYNINFMFSFPQVVKPVHRGVKLWVRCDSISAYCQQFEVYLDKSSSNPSRNGQLFDVVWNLVKSIQGKNHHIFFDNLYSNLPIAKFLYLKQFYMCSTIRSNRKYLPEKIKKPGKMQRGESKSFPSKRLSNLTATVWQDMKDVRFLSTLNKPGIITKCTRRVGHRRIEVTMPSAASSYGKYYSAVDSYDRLCGKKVYGNLGHGSNKLWKHLMWHFCNLAIGNAWVIFQKVSQRQNPKNYDHLSFRHELATQLIGIYSSRKKTTNLKHKFNTTAIDNMGSHELVRMNCKQPKHCVGHRTYQPNQKTRKETVYGCFQCNSHFCWDCFIIAHTNNWNKWRTLHFYLDITLHVTCATFYHDHRKLELNQPCPLNSDPIVTIFLEVGNGLDISLCATWTFIMIIGNWNETNNMLWTVTALWLSFQKWEMDWISAYVPPEYLSWSLEIGIKPTTCFEQCPQCDNLFGSGKWTGHQPMCHLNIYHDNRIVKIN